MTNLAKYIIRVRFAELERNLADVTTQRDELLTACKWIADSPFAHKGNMIAVATAAVAKVQS